MNLSTDIVNVGRQKTPPRKKTEIANQKIGQLRQ